MFRTWMCIPNKEKNDRQQQTSENDFSDSLHAVLSAMVNVYIFTYMLLYVKVIYSKNIG